jgi:type I restriction enzyme S subunit
MEAIGEKGELDLSAVRDIEDVRTGYTQFFDGDVLIAKITPCFENGKGALVRGTLQGVGFGTTELHVLTPSPEVDGQFLYYITASELFRKLGEAGMTGAAGQKRVPEDFVRDFRVPVPPIYQQRAIADYLDRETARLDGLMAAKSAYWGWWRRSSGRSHPRRHSRPRPHRSPPRLRHPLARRDSGTLGNPACLFTL